MCECVLRALRGGIFLIVSNRSSASRLAAFLSQAIDLGSGMGVLFPVRGSTRCCRVAGNATRGRVPRRHFHDRGGYRRRRRIA